MSRPAPPRMVPASCPHCGAKRLVVSGAWLRRIRQETGVSLRAAARRFGFSAAYLSDIELGRRKATDEMVSHYQCEFLPAQKGGPR